MTRTLAQINSSVMSHDSEWQGRYKTHISYAVGRIGRTGTKVHLLVVETITEDLAPVEDRKPWQAKVGEIFTINASGCNTNGNHGRIDSRLDTDAVTCENCKARLREMEAMFSMREREASPAAQVAADDLASVAYDEAITAAAIEADKASELIDEAGPVIVGGERLICKNGATLDEPVAPIAHLTPMTNPNPTRMMCVECGRHNIEPGHLFYETPKGHELCPYCATVWEPEWEGGLPVTAAAGQSSSDASEEPPVVTITGLDGGLPMGVSMTLPIELVKAGRAYLAAQVKEARVYRSGETAWVCKQATKETVAAGEAYRAWFSNSEWSKGFQGAYLAILRAIELAASEPIAPPPPVVKPGCGVHAQALSEWVPSKGSNVCFWYEDHRGKHASIGMITDEQPNAHGWMVVYNASQFMRVPRERMHAI